MKNVLFVIQFVFLIFIISCNKENEKKQNHQFLNQVFNYNMNFESYYNLEGLKYTKLNNYQIFDSTYLFHNLLDSYGFSGQYNDSHPIVGLIIYLNDSLSTYNYNDLNSLNPSALLVYQKDNNQTYTKLFIGNSIDLSLSCYTSYVSVSDILDVDVIKFFNSKEIIALIDYSKVNKNELYRSEFQIRIDKYFNELNLLNSKTTCSEMNPICDGYNESGTCIEFERQTGPTYGICETVSEKCFEETTGPELERRYAYTPTSSTRENIYFIRDSIMANFIKGKKYIDDYYYFSDNFDALSYSSEFYFRILKLYQSNMINKLSNFLNPNYSDSILINSDNKNDILYLVNEIKNSNSNDVRLIYIMNKLENDINLYYNKSIQTIKNDL